MDRDPIDRLWEEHPHIARVLDALDTLVGHGQLGRKELGLFDAVLDFIVLYADGSHYHKEELVFEKLRELNMPCAQCPERVLGIEHQATRAETERMLEALREIRRGVAAAWNPLFNAANRFTAIVRVHIPKEDGGFFPMSRQVLRPDQKQALSTAFDQIDARLPGRLDLAADALWRAVDALGAPGTGTPPGPRPGDALPPHPGWGLGQRLDAQFNGLSDHLEQVMKHLRAAQQSAATTWPPGARGRRP